jgi:hypothetical protein
MPSAEYHIGPYCSHPAALARSTISLRMKKMYVLSTRSTFVVSLASSTQLGAFFLALLANLSRFIKLTTIEATTGRMGRHDLSMPDNRSKRAGFLRRRRASEWQRCL